jgi:hypothetical protein
MEKMELSVDLLNALMRYLGTRPYQEVFSLVQEIQKQVTPQLPKEEE